MRSSRKTLYEYLCEYAGKHPQKALLLEEQRVISVSETLENAKEFAAYFWRKGIRGGDYVALRMERSADSVILLLALEMLGVIVVLTDVHYGVEEYLEIYAKEIPVKAMLTREEPVSGRDFSGGWKAKYHDEISWQSVERTPWIPEIKITSDSQLPAVILFTSGSTGKSKAVVLSQYNFINNLEDTKGIGGYRSDDIAMLLIPLNHVFGLALMCGAIVLQHTLFFPESLQIDHILSCVEKIGVTRMNGVPSLYQSMAEKAEKYDLHTLSIGLIGGAPCTEQRFQEIEESLGITLVPVYGMSECIGISCASAEDDRKERMRSVGPFYSMNDGKILREDGTEAVKGEEGEICVKGPSRMLGYYSSGKGDVYIDESGYLHTGDLGFLNEKGALCVSGRKKDILIRNGNNISIKKMEDAFLRIPEVREAAVVGLPDEQEGEVPGVMVSGRGEDMSEQELRRLLDSNRLLSRLENPAIIRIVNEIPKTTSGKMDKVQIRKELAKWKKEQGR